MNGNVNGVNSFHSMIMSIICKFKIGSKILYNVLRRMQILYGNKLYISREGLLFYTDRNSISLHTDTLKDYVYNNTSYICYSLNKTSIYTSLPKKKNDIIEVSISSEEDKHILSFEHGGIRYDMSLLVSLEDSNINHESLSWIEIPKTTIVIHEIKLLNNLIKHRSSSALFISTVDNKIRIGGMSDYIVLDNEHRGESICAEIASMKLLKKVFPIYSDYCIFNFDVENQKVDIIFIEHNVIYKYKVNYYTFQT